MRRALVMLAGLVAASGLCSWSLGGDGGVDCCPHCGCHEIKKVCRLVPEVIKVPVTEYTCKCEDICVPGKSCYVGKECVTDCDGNCCQQKVYTPTCGKVYTKVSPQKTTKMVEKCGYKCVVEVLCCRCGQGCVPTAPAAAPGPAGSRTIDPEHWHRSN